MGAGRRAVQGGHVQGHREVSALESRYWFPAKRYGWGWGPPRTWQGWLVLVAFFALLAVGALVFLPKQQPGSFIIYTAFLVVVLIAVCYLTGEPPRWRWGKKSNN
jgi:drug/metabolite transporter (DMT)-like permease